MRNLFLRLLVALLCCLSLVQNAWSDNDDREEVSAPLEKGRFYQANVFGKKPNGCSVVYTADASAMQRTWSSSDFKLLNDVYTTGPYTENKIYTAVSPTIHIPSISYNDRLFVCLEEMFEVESGYDYVWIDVTTDGGDVWHRLYGKCGYTEGMVIDYLDASFLSGKDVKFKVSLKSDSSYTAAGWDIKMFEVLFYDRSKQNKNIERKSELRSARMPKPVTPGIPGENGGEEGDSGENNQTATVSVDSMKIMNVQWESKDEGVISFSAYNGSDFVSEIDLKNVSVVIKKDGKEIKTIKGSDGCLSFDKDRSQNMVDIVLVVDYSTSMAGAIKNLRSSMLNMLTSIEDRYDARFSLLQYGQGDDLSSYFKNRISVGDQMFWVLDNKNNYFYNFETLKSMFGLCTKCGCFEYAYDGLMNAINMKKYRPGAEKIVILLYDYDGESPSIKYSYDQVLAALEGVQLFTVTDGSNGGDGKKYNSQIKNLALTSAGDYVDKSFPSDVLKVKIETGKVELRKDTLDFIFVEKDNEGKEIKDTISFLENYFTKQSEKEVTIPYYELYYSSPYTTPKNKDGCKILKEYASETDDASIVFSNFSKKISDNLLNRHYLRISSDCFTGDSPLICGDNYSISLVIGNNTETTNTTYIYPGTIIRSNKTKMYDTLCLNEDLPIEFRIAGGCENSIYGDAKISYVYSGEDSIIVDSINRPEDGVYRTILPLKKKSGIKYRIEVEQEDGNDVVFPSQYGFLDGYWNVTACGNGNGKSPKISSEVICISDTVQRINMSVNLENAQDVKNGSVYLFFKRTNNDTLSTVFDHKKLESKNGKKYSFDSLVVDDKRFLDYYILYVDSVSKSIIAHSGNGMDSVNRVNITELECMDKCHNIQLSSHILTEKNDTLQFDVYKKETKAEIYLCDTTGNKLIRKEITLLSMEKEKKIALISELGLRDKQFNLKYVVPYLLVLKIEESIHYMYVYLGRKN